MNKKVRINNIHPTGTWFNMRQLSRDTGKIFLISLTYARYIMSHICALNVMGYPQKEIC